jgi:hypothetical protein
VRFHSWTHIMLSKLNLFWTIFWTSESCVTSFSAPDGSQMQRSADCPQSKRVETSSSLSQLSPPTRGTSGSRLSTIQTNRNIELSQLSPPTRGTSGSPDCPQSKRIETSNCHNFRHLHEERAGPYCPQSKRIETSNCHNFRHLHEERAGPDCPQ